MTPTAILQLRLRNQQLLNSSFTKPEELVRWMGAIQAQDYAGCKWAVGLRTGADDNRVEEAIDKAKIIRTHVLRPTWHLVHPEDIRWMLMLTAPRVHALSAFGYRQMELTDAIFKQANKAIVKALQGNKQLTRLELQAALQRAKISTNELRFIHIMVHAEQDALVCNGARQGKQFTYALLDEQVPSTKTITKEEALVKLTARYFKSHGPATLQDYTWWSGLSAKDAQLGLASVKSSLISEMVEGKTYWMDHPTAGSKPAPAVLLLPAFDEYTVSYKDRSFAVDAALAKRTGNGIFKPALMVDGKIKGIWKRNDKKGEERAEIIPFENLTSAQIKKIKTEIQKYSVFLGY